MSKVTYLIGAGASIEYLECILKIGSGYLGIEEERGHYQTGNALPVCTSKQKYVEEVGLSDSYIKKLARDTVILPWLRSSLLRHLGGRFKARSCLY